MAEGLGKGLQNLVQQFKSASDLIFNFLKKAAVVKLVYTRDLKSLGLIIRVGSSPTRGTLRQL